MRCATLALLMILLAGAASAGPAAPENAAPDALALVQKVNARDVGSWSTRHVVMELISRRGSKRTREAMLFHRFFGQEKRIALFYLSPVTIEGTAFLTWDQHAGRDLQWLYLPALRKTRRISTQDRGKSFMGTDLSYEDLKQEMKISEADYRFERVGREPCGAQQCVGVEGIPVSPTIARELGYGRVRWWIDEATWMVRLAEYWDPSGRALKTTRIEDVRNVDGVWTAGRIDVENLQSGHRTVFRVDDVDLATEVPASLFERNNLIRGWRH